MVAEEEAVIHVGPQHPGFGPYELLVKISGDKIIGVDPVIGFVHRGLEKLVESRRWIQIIPITDRFCFMDPAFGSVPYVLALEKLLKWDVPERAQYLRVIGAELSRIINHLTWFMMMASATGLGTAGMWSWRERERMLYLAEILTGGRFAWNYFYPGGVRFDITDRFIEETKKQFEKVRKYLKDMYRLMFNNRTFIVRTQGIGIVSKNLALKYGITGPNLRASGVRYDLRKAAPYLVYDKIDFDVPTEKDGDVYSRALVRYYEVEQSMSIIEQAIKSLPEGLYNRVKKYSLYLTLKVPAGEAVGRHEAARGFTELYVVSGGGLMPERIKFRSPSFAVIQAVREILVGIKIADLPVIMASFDYCPGDSDR